MRMPKNSLNLGASHVIVTSFVFAGGKVHYDRLDALKEQVGREIWYLTLVVEREMTNTISQQTAGRSLRKKN